jgi:hypothetical protein
VQRLMADTLAAYSGRNTAKGAGTND